ncbi:MAG: hypothetical protein JKY51_00420, partial [Opitutaceae bacterium]|nr:hypothetical protein [Opitutaceae bacterium]
DFDDFEPAVLEAEKGDQLLAECSEFRIQKYVRNSIDEEMIFPEKNEVRLLSIVSGEVTLRDIEKNESIACKGDSVILPYGEMIRMAFEQDVVFLVTDKFA